MKNLIQIKKKRILRLIPIIFLCMLMFGKNSSPRVNNNDERDEDLKVFASNTVITDVVGGYKDASYVRNNYTSEYPWSYLPEYFSIYWIIEYTSDKSIANFWYNLTFGELDVFNGTPSTSELWFENWDQINSEIFVTEFYLEEGVNDFYFHLEITIEDVDGAFSDVFSEVFKYHKGTVEDPDETLELDAVSDSFNVKDDGDIGVNFSITDPEGSRNYPIAWGCNRALPEHTEVTMTINRAEFNLGYGNKWDLGESYIFSFNLTVWELSSIVADAADSVLIYINQPPENGTCTIAPVRELDPAYGGDFQINCTGWQDDLDGFGLFFIARVVNSEWYSSNPVHEGTYDTSFTINLDPKYCESCQVRVTILDSHGASTEFDLGTVYPRGFDRTPDPDEVPTGIPFGTAGLIWGSLGMVGLLLAMITKKIGKTPRRV